MDALPADKTYFPALTGVRTIAAYMVFLAHFGSFNLPWFNSIIHGFFKEFHVGVTIFFVLSGFLICYRYFDPIKSGKIRLRDYFIIRFARIYPIYFLVTLFSFLPVFCHCSFSENGRLIFLNLTFLRGFFDEYKFTGAPAGWSLTVEETFYCLFPLIVFISGRWKILLQPLLFLGIGLFLWLVFRNLTFHGFFSSLQFLFEYTFFGRCVEFYSGMLLALYLKKNASSLEPKSHVYRTTLGMACIFLCITLLVLNRKYCPDPGKFLFHETLVNNFLLPLGIVIWFYGLLVEESVLRKLLSSRLFEIIGKSSYVFYLIHNSFLFALLYFHLDEKLQYVFILIQLIAMVVYLKIEKPMNNFIRRKFISTAS